MSDSRGLVESWFRSGQSGLSEEVALAILKDSEVLACQDPALMNLVRVVRAFGLPEHAALLRQEIRMCRLMARAFPEPFLENLPPLGLLPRLAPGRVPLVGLPLSGTLSIEVGLGGTSRNVIFVGPTGSGKTNSLLVFLLALVECAVSVVFTRKGDLARLGRLSRGVVVLEAFRDVKLALFQPIAGMRLAEFISQTVEVLARCLHLEASRRLITDQLFFLFERKGSHGVSLSDLVRALERLDANAWGRAGQYKEASLYALKDLWRRTGGILDFEKSSFLDTVFSDEPKTVVVECGSIATDHLSLVVSMFIMHAYETRKRSGQRVPPVVISVDDALPLVTGSSAQESEGGMNLLSNWAFMSRGLNLGLVVGCQTWGLLSPALRTNADTIVCVGAQGDDAWLLGRHLNLTGDQTSVLPRLRPGEAVVMARSVWPLAVKGLVPEVK